MLTRKEMKKRAKQIVRAHYAILFCVCLISSFLGAEFSGSLDFVTQQNVSETPVAEASPISLGVFPQNLPADLTEAVGSALFGNTEKGQQLSREIREQAVKNTKAGKGNPILGRSRGVLAGLVNNISSGAFVIAAVSSMYHLGISRNAVLAIFILLALLIFGSVWFFLVNMYQAVSRRIFLESRTYEKVTMQRFLFFLRVRKWSKVSLTMFMSSLLYMLWSLTIAGAFVKKYSYYLVPYITAENPDMHWREVITLSRRMMHGHKWECFVFEMTFLPWDILGSLTFGILQVLFINAYKTASFTEYYAELRRLARARDLDGSQLLNDRYLFQKAAPAVLENAYQDIVLLEKMPKPDLPLPSGFRSFLANAFGITLFHRKDEALYRDFQERKLKISAAKAAVSGLTYPGRLFPIPENKKNQNAETLHYLRRYSLPTLILLFFIFSFIGWLWEVSLHLISDGVFVNRGVLHGPWLPIYGTGSILILTLLNRFRQKPALEFIAAVLLCGCVEYFTAYYLELAHNGQKWWDYSGYFLNLHGRICAEGLLVFGVGSLAIVYLAAPLLDNQLRKLKYRIALPLCAVLLLLFTADQIYSHHYPNTGTGISSYTGAP